MKKIETIDKIYEYLKVLREETRKEYVKPKHITKSDMKELSFTNLVKHGILNEFKQAYTWNFKKCDYALAFNLHQKIKKGKQSYENLLEVIDNPQGYSVNDLMFALNVKTKNDESNGIKLEMPNMLTASVELFEDNLPSTTSKPFIFKNKEQENPIGLLGFDAKQLDLLINIESRFEEQQKELFIMRELLSDMVHGLMSSMDSTENSRRSISMSIAILKTNQENLMTISSVLLQLVRDNYIVLQDKIKISEDETETAALTERLKAMGETMKYLRKQVDNNVAIINKYGGSNS